jgi:mRNA-degrading endonuclease YafQ of YafQ-DinJ toxin-antitoxin module
MLKIGYQPSFVRIFDELEVDLQNEIQEKINIFRDPRYHKQLRVHKLHGALKHLYSFSVNYEIRIVFKYLSANEVALLQIGNHDIYR